MPQSEAHRRLGPSPAATGGRPRKPTIGEQAARHAPRGALSPPGGGGLSRRLDVDGP